MSDLINALLENNAFDDMRAECPECSNIEDEQYTCTACMDGALEVDNIVCSQQKENEQLEGENKKLCEEIEKLNDFKAKWNLEVLNQIEQANKDKQELAKSLDEAADKILNLYNGGKRGRQETHDKYKALAEKHLKG